MTNYSSWESKAKALVEEAEEEDAKAKEESDKALGLTEGPKGPPTVKAEEQMKELGDHSDQRKGFIELQKKREVTVTHSKQDEVVDLSAASEYKLKAVRISGSADVKYVVPPGSEIIKLMIDKCKGVQIDLQDTLLTSNLELYACDNVTVVLSSPMGTVQVDECEAPVEVSFADVEHVGKIYHQNSPGLKIEWRSGNGAGLHEAGRKGAAQWVTCVDTKPRSAVLITAPVKRGEGEFPLDLDGKPLEVPGLSEPDEEALPAVEEKRKQADAKRLSGNDMFRANDFMQAAAEYTASINLDPTVAAVFANRSQCWLKLGNHEKALADAEKVIELDPSNAKGWFRKGMSLHAMERYPEAIPALAEAEKLDPKNKQIPDAIKMAQMKARKQAASGY